MAAPESLDCSGWGRQETDSVHGTRARVRLALLLAVLLVPALDSPAVARTAAEKYAHSAVKATNANRVDNDLEKVTLHKCLRKRAVVQARKMANREEIFHQDLVAVLTRCGMTNVGENVAVGFRTGRATVNKGWMKSPEHRVNILSPVFRRMGIGARKGDDGRWYVCQLFGKKA